MTSLDKLAKMDGWDVGEDDDAEDGSVDVSAMPVAAGQQSSFGETIGKLGGGAHIASTVPPGTDDNEPNHISNSNLPPCAPGEGIQQNNVSSSSSSSRSSDLPSEMQASLPSTRLDSPCQERNAKNSASKISPGSAVFDRLFNTYPVIAREGSIQAASATATSEIWGTLKRHPLDTLRKRGFGSDSGSRVGGILPGEGRTTVEEITKMRTSLKRAHEEIARERERREVCEEQTRMAHVALETESKRALELENRVRVAEMTISQTQNNQDGIRRGGGSREGASRDGAGGVVGGGVSSKIDTWERRVRSLSPGRGGARAAEIAQEAERQANLAVLAQASEAAREEAQSALDTVEGFAALNRKLVDELRAAVSARDEALENLRMERSEREQLEEDIGEMLGGGLVAEFEQSKQELEARCKTGQEETARVVAMHARMEEEYRLALSSSDQERARLEETIASLESELLGERRQQAIRATEASERAAMGSEEVRSLRAGLYARTKRRGHKRYASGRAGEIGGSSGKESGWLGVVQARMEAQQQAARRAPIHNRANSHCGSGSNRQRGSRQYQRSTSAAVASAGGPPMANHAPPATRAGGSSIEAGSTGSEDWSVVQAVHMAAVEVVEVFLGDFMPEVPPVAATLSASLAGSGAEKAKGGEGDGGGSAAGKNVSKWAAIGRAGKISARATAVCVEEATKAAEAAALHRLRALTSASARALSASWFSLLGRATGGTAAQRRHGHGHDGFADEHSGGGGGEGTASAGATVPVIAVRRLVQSCGILQGTAGAPTLAHADMELQRNAVGKGGRSIGHREYFKVIFALTQYRFAGEPKDETLEKLSRMLRQAQTSPGTAPHPHNRQTQTHASAPSVKPTPTRAAATPTTAGTANANSPSPGGHEEGLAGAERVLERDRRALEAIFSHYSTSSLLPFAALASFCKDFELTPGLISREDAHQIYVQFAYPDETLLTPKLVAAREGPQGQRAAAAAGRNAKDGEGGAPATGFGLRLDQWIAWLGLAAVGCTWFDKQRGLYNTPTKKVLGLLQWMEGSAGKKRIGSTRGSAIVPAFNLLPPKATAARR